MSAIDEAIRKVDEAAKIAKEIQEGLSRRPQGPAIGSTAELQALWDSLHELGDLVNKLGVVVFDQDDRRDGVLHALSQQTGEVKVALEEASKLLMQMCQGMDDFERRIKALEAKK